MDTKIRVLILEDRKSDADLMLHELCRAGFDPAGQRVDNEADFTVFQDVTGRKRAEEVLGTYRVMVESAHDVIFFKDLESRYVIANAKALEAFGLSREEVIGRNDREIMPDEEEARKNIEDDQRVLKTGQPAEVAKHMTGADGGEHWFHTIKVPRFDREGRVVGLKKEVNELAERLGEKPR